MTPKSGSSFTEMPMSTVTASTFPASSSCVPSRGSTHTVTSFSATLSRPAGSMTSHGAKSCMWCSSSSLTARAMAPSSPAMPMSYSLAKSIPSSPTTASSGKRDCSERMTNISHRMSARVWGSNPPSPSLLLTRRSPASATPFASCPPICANAMQQPSTLAMSLRAGCARTHASRPTGSRPGAPTAVGSVYMRVRDCVVRRTTCSRCGTDRLCIPTFASALAASIDAGSTPRHISATRYRV